jgi:hypothetical protein
VNQYYVETLVRFSGTVEAETLAEAEELGYYMENLQYDSVEIVDAELVYEEGDEDEDTEEDEA